MDQLAETLPIVLKHFGWVNIMNASKFLLLDRVVLKEPTWNFAFFSHSLRSVIGMGVGAGANILTRFAVSFICIFFLLHVEWPQF